MPSKNYHRYTAPVISEQKRARQKELFREHYPSWRELSDDDIASLTAILFAYLCARLNGSSI